MPSIPWVGLAALIAMFVLPFLPAWLFERPRTVRHWPRRHVCGNCNAPWTDGHVCAPGGSETVPPLHGELRRASPSTAGTIGPRLRGQLRRVKPRGELARRPGARIG